MAENLGMGRDYKRKIQEMIFQLLHFETGFVIIYDTMDKIGLL